MLVTTLAASVALGLCAAATVSQPPAPRPHTRADTIAQVRKDIAARDGVDPATLVVAREEDRTWDDADLGCAARKGLREPAPVPGYLIVLRAGDRTWEYHADRTGRIKRCPPAKPRAQPASSQRFGSLM